MRTILVILLFAAANAFAQPGPDTLWTRFYGWTGDDTAFSLQQTADHGFIIAGVATVPQSGYANGFLVKADSNGVMQGWHSYGGDNDDGFYSVVADSEGGYTMAGYSSNAGGWRRQYFIRVNSLGEAICSHVYDHDDLYHEWWTSVSRTTVGDFFAVGQGGTTTPGRNVAWAERFSTTCLIGGIPMTAVLTGATVHRAHCFSEGTMITGRCINDTSGAVQAFLIRWASDFPFLGMYGGDGYDDEAYDVVRTAWGYIAAGSSYDGQRYGIFLCAIDFAGNPLLIQRHFTDLSEWAEAIIPAMEGGYIVAGTRQTDQSGKDMLLAKVNNAGEIVWERSYGTASDDQAYDVVQTADSGFMLVGYSNAHLGVGTEWYFVKTAPDTVILSTMSFIPHPSTFRLSAFPNPFNPSTTITFDLPQTQPVTLAVYDLLGREVATLLNAPQTAGTHTVRFDGAACPSGLYFARLTVAGSAHTQKLMLLK